MGDSEKIPVKNIYHMMCYAWNTLDASGEIFVDGEEFDNIYHLFARVYLKGVQTIVMQGIDRGYVSALWEERTVRGKIAVRETISQMARHNGTIICRQDEYSEDILCNQIVKKTMRLLLKAPGMEEENKIRLREYLKRFDRISDVEFSDKLFQRLRFQGMNRRYQLLLHISSLLYYGLLVTEQKGKYLFADFIRDRQMAVLFEKFVLNFYRCHLDKRYRVYSPIFRWQLDKEPDLKGRELLPDMRTDIVVEDRAACTQLIIDTKYYAQTLVASRWSDKEKIRNVHLNQLFTYMNNSTFQGAISGFLLYPVIHQEVNRDFLSKGKVLGIRTVNLNEDWRSIEAGLLSLI